GIVGEITETLLPPEGVARWCAFRPPAPTTQSRHMPIADFRRLQRQRQHIAIEVRIAARARDAAHVDQTFDAVFAQQGAKFVEIAGRMADGVDRHAVLRGRDSSPFKRNGARLCALLRCTRRRSKAMKTARSAGLRGARIASCTAPTAGDAAITSLRPTAV